MTNTAHNQPVAATKAVAEQPFVTIDAATTIGLISLTVADLERSMEFYATALGFAVLAETPNGATLGAAGVPLLLLTAHPGAQAWPRDRASYTGLYHLAILMPARADLGRWLRHWLTLGFPLPGQGDHLVSEALYLEDPDGNGIEVYRDRPRAEWPYADGQLRMAADPVDLRGLIADAEREDRPWEGLPAGTRLGHIHLQVGDIARTAAFYHDILGFEVMVSMPTALFMAAGGYHHHIGANVWHSAGAGPAPAGTAGLRFFTVDLPSEQAREAVVERVEAAGLPHTRSGSHVVVRDPWDNAIVLHVGTAPDAETATALTTAVEG